MSNGGRGAVKLSPPVVSIYLMADTDTADLAAAAAGAGAGLFEIGIPYSDPLADGPTVQRAGQRSLRGGMTTPRALGVLRDIRARVGVPLVPMGLSETVTLMRPIALRFYFVRSGRRRAPLRPPCTE